MEESKNPVLPGQWKLRAVKIKRFTLTTSIYLFLSFFFSRNDSSRIAKRVNDSRINPGTIVIDSAGERTSAWSVLPIRLSRDVRLMANCQADTIHTINTGAHHCPILAHRAIRAVSLRSVRLPSFRDFLFARSFRASLTRPKHPDDFSAPS